MNIGPTGGGGSAHLPQQAKPLAAPATAEKTDKAEVGVAKSAEATSEVKPVSSVGTAGSIINTSA